MEPVYKRVLIKLSGEALEKEMPTTILPSGNAVQYLQKDEVYTYDKEKLTALCAEIAQLHGMGVQIALVIGAGNIWRGKLAQNIGFDAATADYMGMLGTAINALALSDMLQKQGLRTQVLSPFGIQHVAQEYSIPQARAEIQTGTVLIFACGLGLPFFTTDTPAAQRAVELQCDALLLAKNISKLYDRPPEQPGAVPYTKTTYNEIIAKQLGAFDLTAAVIGRQYNLHMQFFGLNDENGILRAACGLSDGTTITN